MKVIGIVGSRRRDSADDFADVRAVFYTLYEDGDKIVSGHCPKGGDRFAEILAAEVGATEANGRLILHRAQWDEFGKSAGFKRNTDIARDATDLIACVATDRTGGTEDTIRKFKRMKPDATVILV